MTAAGLPEPGGSALSIGSVLDALRADFPDITISKIRFLESDRKSTRLNSSHIQKSRMPSSA